jgi:predicted DNA-binding transcriptional regulator AlpA
MTKPEPTAGPVRLIPTRDVLSRRGTGRTKLREDIAAGLFPPALKLGYTLRRWPQHEADAVVRATVSGATEAEVKALVSELVRLRQHLAPALLKRGGADA